MGAIERQLNRAIVRLRETQTQRRKSAVPHRAPVKTMSAPATEFVSSPPAHAATHGSAVPQPGAQLVTSHQPLATDHRPLTTAD
jgi:hypothetical protein